MPCSLAQTMRHHYLDNIPYSKMCELCELCELFVKKFHRFRDGIFIFSTQQNFRGPQRALLEWGELKPKSPQLLRSSGSLRP